MTTEENIIDLCFNNLDITNQLLNDICNNDLSNITATTLQRSTKILTDISNSYGPLVLFLKNLEKLNKRLD